MTTGRHVMSILLLLCLMGVISLSQCDLRSSFRPHLSGEVRDMSYSEKRVAATKRTQLVQKLLKRLDAVAIATSISTPDNNVYTTSTSSSTDTQATDTVTQTSNSGTYSVSSSYGASGTSISGGAAQYQVISSTSRYYTCNTAFNGSPIPWIDAVVKRSLNSFLKELDKNSKVLSISQSCSLLYYWRKRMEQATSASSCDSSEPTWCMKSSSAAASSVFCTPLYCTKNPGKPCLTFMGERAKCRLSFPIKCIISCLKLNIKTSDPATLTNVINNMQKLSTREFQPAQKSAITPFLVSRGLLPKRQAMMSNCPTCGCLDGGNSCNVCYTWAPTGTPCWDPDYSSDCCQCLVLS